MRSVLLAGCVLALAACTGPIPAPEPERAEPEAGIRLSGYATIGYIKGR